MLFGETTLLLTLLFLISFPHSCEIILLSSDVQFIAGLLWSVVVFLVFNSRVCTVCTVCAAAVPPDCVFFPEYASSVAAKCGVNKTEAG